MNEPLNGDHWRPCQGEITQLRRNLVGRRVRRRALLAGSGAVLIAAALGVSLLQQSPAPAREFLTCGDMRDYSNAYFTGDLDEETVRRVNRHLKHCPKCRQAYDRRGESGRQGPPQGPSRRTTI